MLLEFATEPKYIKFIRNHYIRIKFNKKILYISLQYKIQYKIQCFCISQLNKNFQPSILYHIENHEKIHFQSITG